MRRPRPPVRRLRDLTLRTKLIAVLVALSTVAFLAVAAATTLALRHFLLGQLDQQVRDASARFSVLFERPADRDADNKVRQFETVAGQAAGTLGARLRGRRVLAAAIVRGPTGTPRAIGAQNRAMLASLRGARQPRTVDLAGLGEYRVIAVAGLRGETLLTGLPTGPVDGTVHRLIGIELVVYAITLGAVAAIGTTLVRLTLRPLNRITDTAARVAALPLTAGPVSLSDDEDVDRETPRPGDTEVGTLTAAFDRMLHNVEQSFAARQASEERLRRFLGDASHELRTPVAVIRGHAELARTAGPLPAAVDHALDRIVAESQRMGHMVDDLLLLARLNSGRAPTRTEVDLSRVVLDTVSDARAAGPDHRWRLDLPDEPVEVVGDPHALHQAVANLLANARRHTPAGTTVLTTLRSSERDVTISVCDDGPGIPPDVLPHILQRFVHADDTRPATTGGSGLGLTIVDAIVRSHGGSIDVTSRAGATRFVVRLPGAGS